MKSEKKPVKILCLSDVKSPLVYSSNIKERFGDVDLVIGAGDLVMDYYGFIVSMLNKHLYFVFGNHNLKHLRRFKFPKHASAEQHDFMGNPQSHEVMTDYFGSTYIGGKVVYLKEHDLIIAGMGGCMRYNRGENQYTDLYMHLKLMRLVPKLLWNRLVRGRFLDIFITHAPPKGIHDQEDRCHQGFSGFLWFMRRFRPRYLLHGHVHLIDMNQQRESTYHDTQVINVYEYYLLEVQQ